MQLLSKYRIKDHTLVLDQPLILSSPFSNVVKPYRIHDLPNDEKPREKLIAQGPAALSTSELLAVILNVGTKKEGVLAMAQRIVKEYGDRALVSHTDAAKLAEDLGIPTVRAAQVVACGELGRRFFQKRGTGALIRTAKDVYDYLRVMETLDKEHLRGIYLNGHHRVVHDEVISIGTVDANIVHPREVFRPAIEYGAVAVILAHNHPSGITKPSAADIEITKQIVEAGKIMGVSVLDHVIIAKGKFASIEIDYN